MLLDQRKPKCYVLKSVLSTSGKYKLFYGTHYVQGKTCFDVGSINQLNGEIITRHYQAKEEALRVFHDYEKDLTKPAEAEESDDLRAADSFRRALKQWP